MSLENYLWKYVSWTSMSPDRCVWLNIYWVSLDWSVSKEWVQDKANVRGIRVGDCSSQFSWLCYGGGLLGMIEPSCWGLGTVLWGWNCLPRGLKGSSKKDAWMLDDGLKAETGRHRGSEIFVTLESSAGWQMLSHSKTLTGWLMGNVKLEALSVMKPTNQMIAHFFSSPVSTVSPPPAATNTVTVKGTLPSLSLMGQAGGLHF